MLSEELKEQTKINHQILEKKLVAQMKAISNKEDYAILLGLFYSFFGGLEIAMGKYPDLSFLPDQELRRKASALENDLKALQISLPKLASVETLPKIENHLQTIGAMYVMEGSTLGGKYIVKMIEKQLDTTDLSSLTFFKSYGDDTEKMWQIFKNALDNFPLTSTEKDIVINAANDTFVTFNSWFDNNQA